ncbi:hypothetical protein JCM1840_005804 [Sporobolomyces johnsonii]
MSSGIQHSVSGLGITFDSYSPTPEDAPDAYGKPYLHGHPAHAPHLHRTLQHSISYDDGLSRRMQMQPMIRQESEDSAGSSQRRVRIAAGTPEVLGAGKGQLYLHHPHNLSPLSDFTSASDTGSSQPFSPASLSSLPSSTESGAYPSFRSLAPGDSPAHQTHEPRAPGMEAEQSRPYPPSEASDSSSYHQLSARAPSQQRRTSRLPAFLQERQRAQGLSRPKSMVELGQLYSMQEEAPPTQIHPAHYEDASSQGSYSGLAYAEHEQQEGYGLTSPESVPSSAGGLHRRHLERQLQEQKQLLEEERRRLRASEGRPRAREPQPQRPIARSRSRSLSAQEMKQLAEAESSRMPRSRSQSADVRSQASMQGLQLAETGGAFISIDRHSRSFSAGEEITPFSTSAGMAMGEETVVEEEGVDDEGDRGTVISMASDRPLTNTTSLSRQSTLLTAGANPVRRSRELNRLLAPTGKKGSVSNLTSIAGSPTLSTSSSAITASTRQRAPSRASMNPSIASAVPLVLEGAKSTSKARVELDLVLETPLVVEGGTLKGRLEVRVRKPKEKEGEVWVGRPKVRVVGFEELASHDARHIFFHHASSVSTVDGPNGSSLPLPCMESDADDEGFCQGRVGQHTVPFKMVVPIGKGAKGGWKGKQGVVRYIAIASIKLKSKNGADRSIAHFYRHVEIFPYFNPALLLAPAVKPLFAEASKGLFMGGSGKVNLSAKMHRGTWVAGQRCYVDVRVENESSKKIKTLTLALIRTTTVFRPRPQLNAGSGRDPLSGDADLDADACQTQTTRKKVTETTLEMGKKGSKGVTAKGSWMGVEAGDSADFSHSLLVPPDALSISRGRHLEVTYSVKVSVGGSLSADVSTDIPVRIVNFVSLDPPPGHIGASPLPEHSTRPLARSWSRHQVKGGRAESMRKRDGMHMTRMASLDSLRLSDLNGGRGPSRLGGPTLSRIASLDSVRTDDLPRGQTSVQGTPMSRIATASEPLDLPPMMARGGVIVDRARDRQLQHQMSLQCITSAIASATARRQSPVQEEPSGLLSGGSSADAQRWENDEQEEEFYGGGGQHLYDDHGSLLQQDIYSADGMGIQLDDLDEVPDDAAYLDREAETANEDLYFEESDDELDAFMQSRFSEDEDEEPEERPSSRMSKPPASPRWAERPVTPASPVVTRSPAVRSRASSPIKPSLHREAPTPRSAMKRSPDKFAFATPDSPVKAHVDLPSAEPAQFSTPQPSDFPAPPARAARPLPTRPASVSGAPSPTKSSLARKQSIELSKKTSTTSLKRSSAVMKKTPSARSLRSTESDHLPELDSASARSYSDADTLPTPPPTASRTSPSLSVASSDSRKSRSSLMLPPAVPTSPRKVVAKVSAPALRTTRSISDLRTAPTPPPARRSAVLPSVKTKVAALETREATLNKFAQHTSGRARVSSMNLERADSISSQSEASFKLSDLTRANSMASFKAPMLKRNFSDMPPVPSLPQ